MAGVLDDFSDLFPPFFDSPTMVITIDSLSLNTDILTPSTASSTRTVTPTPKPTSNTPLKTSSDAPPTRTITRTETHSVSASDPDTSALPEVNPTITVQHNVTATLTQSSILTSSVGPTSVQSFAHRNKALSSSATVGITIAIVAGILLVLSLVLFLLYNRRRRRAQQRDAEMRPQISWPMPLQASPSGSTWTTDTKGRYRTLSLTTSLTTARSPGPLSPILETEPSTPLSPGSDPHLSLVGAGPLMRPATIYARPVHMHLPQIRREVDAGCVMHGQLEDGYPHEYYERDGSEVVEEPLPPAYEDLPPRGRPGGSIPANRV